MTPEEFQRIKEAEKEHLRAMRKLKNAVRSLERQKKTTAALTDMAKSTENVLSTHETMLDKLAMETIQNEAKLEIALEQSSLQSDEVAPDTTATSRTTSTASQSPAMSDHALEQETQRLKAKELIKSLKNQMSAGTLGRDRPSETGAKPESDSTGASPSTGDDSAESDPLPEKTIGRMRRDS